MITYSQNAVKLIATRDKEHVRLMILQTGQVLTVPIEQLEADNPVEITNSLAQLTIEKLQLERWREANQ